MSRSFRRWASAPMALALAFTLASCSGDEGDGSSAGGEDLTWEDSPLNEVLGGLDTYGDMSEEEAQAQADEQMRRIEEQTAECMAEQGFEYQPMDNSGGSTDYEFYDNMDTVEWAEQYGYGASTSEDVPWPGEDEEAYVDPNSELLNSMSDSERLAWETALWGDMSAIEYDPEAEVETEIDWSSMGCQGLAQQTILEEDPEQSAIMAVYEDPQFTELFEAMNELYMTDTSDWYDEVNQEWAECMADANYPDFESPEAAQESIYSQIDALYTEANPDPEAEEWVEPDLEPQERGDRVGDRRLHLPRRGRLRERGHAGTVRPGAGVHRREPRPDRRARRRH